MDRNIALKNALLKNHSQEQIERFFAYRLSQPDSQLVKDILEAALLTITGKALACTQLSAAWAAMIEDHSSIPVAVVCGDLIYQGTRLFVCHSPIPTESHGTIIGEWDGHCWLEFAGLIGDPRSFAQSIMARFLKKSRRNLWSSLDVGVEQLFHHRKK